MDIKLAIFDFDGTLMDTRKTIVNAKQETMRQLGLKFYDEDTCAGTIGLSAKIGFQKLYPKLSDELLEECVITYRKLFEEEKEKTPPTLFPYVHETLETLKKAKIETTIATSRNNSSLDEFLNKLGLEGYFSYWLGGDSTELLKPNPDPVLKTLNDLKYKPENAMVIGDMPVDIIMGKSAGVYTCGVTYGNSDRPRLFEAGADYVIDSLSELPAILLK